MDVAGIAGEKGAVDAVVWGFALVDMIGGDPVGGADADAGAEDAVEGALEVGGAGVGVGPIAAMFDEDDAPGIAGEAGEEEDIAGEEVEGDFVAGEIWAGEIEVAEEEGEGDGVAFKGEVESMAEGAVGTIAADEPARFGLFEAAVSLAEGDAGGVREVGVDGQEFDAAFDGVAEGVEVFGEEAFGGGLGEEEDEGITPGDAGEVEREERMAVGSEGGTGDGMAGGNGAGGKREMLDGVMLMGNWVGVAFELFEGASLDNQGLGELGGGGGFVDETEG
jgi:hypothetical protein